MSKALHNTDIRQKPKHGTMKSYVIGFVLSLEFTLLPYYLVVRKPFEGNALLAAILGFAVLQLLIQLVFFLHLGRERGPRWNLLFLVATLGIILVVVAGSIWIISNLHKNMMTTSDAQHRLIDDEAIPQVGGVKTGSCEGVHLKHRVTIKNNAASPSRTEAHLCDTLTFTNGDDTVLDVSFGTYPNHGTYAGKTGRSLSKGKSWTITLSQPGTYQFHDHKRAEITGDFTVTP